MIEKGRGIGVSVTGAKRLWTLRDKPDEEIGANQITKRMKGSERNPVSTNNEVRATSLNSSQMDQ